MSEKPIIAITMGDPGGIGPEVIVRSLVDFEISENFYYLLIGTALPFDLLSDEYGLKLPLNPIPTLEPAFLRDDSINFLDVTDQAFLLLKNKKIKWDVQDPKFKGEVVFDIGEVSAMNAAMAYTSLKVAAYQAATGLVDALVTAPVNKTAIRIIDPKFSGHTEYLAKISRTKKFAMMFVSERLKVTLVTIHVPLKKVSRLLNIELILEKIELTHEILKERLGIAKPRIAVCALNPHGSETGTEEQALIHPAIRQARDKKIQVEGPLPGDQVFHEAYEGRFDAVISMFHDQGLAPFKLIAFRDGVNVTLGLPFVRTSPNHGTAFDIAYKGKAHPGSMKAALEFAAKLVTSKTKVAKSS